MSVKPARFSDDSATRRASEPLRTSHTLVALGMVAVLCSALLVPSAAYAAADPPCMVCDASATVIT
ncbi:MULTISPECIES: hypothetical protein [Cupriavidus]|jgi:hypothetical protein|uniref:hypothetical protein n=1 Tax=Cupriavidus TaxID=106589 RepID=UPI0004B8B89D|nr:MULTISPECIES: hypothetical protein [Cupriavidus]QWC91650.1 hypothetical protein KB891_17955 [Cupriavidus metallidurans]